MKNLNSLIESIHHDDCKLAAFINYCEKAQSVTATTIIGNNIKQAPKWVEGNDSFFETLNIIPKEWNQNKFDFPIDQAEEIADLLFKQPEPCFESFQSLKKHFESHLSNCKITPMRLCELLSATRKLYEMSLRINVGRIVASSTINNLLGVICSLFEEINLNGDKQYAVYLDEKLPEIPVRNDGYLHNKNITFMLKEDKAMNEVTNWHNMDSDCHKLIICMKSLLRENMQRFSFKKEQVTKYSKVMGLSYLQRIVYLFILEVTFEEVQYDDGELLIVPKYSIYMQQYSMLPVQMLKLFLDIGYFIQNYVPSGLGSSMKPYRPTLEIPIKIQDGLINLLNTSTERKSKKSETFKNYKPIVRNVNNNAEIFIVKTTSVIKDVNEEERKIIMKLVNGKEYCPYLPHVLNIYSNGVEFERLQSIKEKNCKESYILKLALDISIALSFLHSKNIVHRDVKPSNIMVRTFNNEKIPSRFVLIDFGVSFEIGEDEYHNENVGTVLFKPTEVWNELKYDEKIDIYSLGATLLYLKHTSKFLSVFETVKSEDVNLNVDMKTIEWELAEFGVKVLEMVNPDPKKRPSAIELKSFFTNLILKEKTE